MKTLLLVSIFLASRLFAQSSSGVSSDGRDFYLGYIQPEQVTETVFSYTKYTAAYVLISSYSDNLVGVSYFDDAGTEQTPIYYQVNANRGIQIPLQVSSMKMDEPGDIPQFRSCHITAPHPVNVQYFSTGADAGGSYLSLATPALGKNYVVASYFDNPAGDAGQNNAEGFFLVIAPFNNTTVKITPSATTKGGHRAKSPYSVKLNRGQCYFVKSGSNQNDIDISGSLVESDKPVAVLGGQENAALGNTSLTFDHRDFMIEQMIPVNFWDTSYVSIPMKDSQPFDPANEGVGQNYRVYAYDSSGSDVLFTSNSGGREMQAARLADPTPEKKYFRNGSNRNSDIELEEWDLLCTTHFKRNSADAKIRDSAMKFLFI